MILRINRLKGGMVTIRRILLKGGNETSYRLDIMGGMETILCIVVDKTREGHDTLYRGRQGRETTLRIDRP